MGKEHLPLTGLPVRAVTPSVLVCGDPQRAAVITEQLQAVRMLAERREYVAYRGKYRGLPVTVCSHGIGAPGAAIAFEELIVAGAKQIVRIGSCGGIQPDLKSGALVIVQAAVQATGYGRETVPAGYPAVADLDLTWALRQAAGQRETAVSLGIVITRDNFYGGVQTPQTPDYATLAAANVLAVEMECAALFLVGSLRGAKTAAILAVDGNVLHSGERMDVYDPQREVVKNAIVQEISIALEALWLQQQNA